MGVGVPSGAKWDETPGSAIGPPPRPDADGPWEIEVTFDGPDRSAYSHPIYIRLTVGSDYPSTAPSVRFASIVHHFMLQKARPHDMLQQYMEAVVADERKEHSLAGTLEAVLTFLATPLHPCDHCDTSYKTVAQENHERWQAIENYVPLRRHPRLFEPSTFAQSDDFAPPFRYYNPSYLRALFVMSGLNLVSLSCLCPQDFARKWRCYHPVFIDFYR